MMTTMAIGWGVTTLAVLFIGVCLLMILVILIQKPKGGGLSGAFGGAGSGSQSVFGSKTGDVATWFTVAMFVGFIFLAMGMQWAIGDGHERIDEPQTSASDVSETDPGNAADSDTDAATQASEKKQAQKDDVQDGATAQQNIQETQEQATPTPKLPDETKPVNQAP